MDQLLSIQMVHTNGMLMANYREHGPAIIYSDGDEKWYINISWPWNGEIQAQFILTFY